MAPGELSGLDMLGADIRGLQDHLVTARLTGNAKLAQIYSKELDRALSERDGLVSRIGAHIGGGEPVDPLRQAA